MTTGTQYDVRPTVFPHGQLGRSFGGKSSASRGETVGCSTTSPFNDPMDLSLTIPCIVDSLKNQGCGSIRAHLDAIPGITNSGNDIESQIRSSDDGGITGPLL